MTKPIPKEVMETLVRSLLNREEIVFSRAKSFESVAQAPSQVLEAELEKLRVAREFLATLEVEERK